MENKCKVSVVIPAYNTERYISRCIDSVLSQTLHDIEIIVINDGSTDGTRRILESYEGKDPRLKIYHQANKGIGASRRKGMDLAKGEYVQFVDSDDWVDPDFIDHTYSLACGRGADVVETGGFFWHDRHGGFVRTQIKLMPEDTVMMSGLDIATGIVKRTHTCSLCTKLIRKRFCQDNALNFNDDIGFGEDAYFMCRLCSFNPVYVYANKSFYHVTDNPTSTTKSKYTRKNFSERVRWVNMLEEQYEDETFRDALQTMKFFIKEEMADSGLYALDEFKAFFPALRHNLAKVKVDPLRKLLYVATERFGPRKIAFLKSNHIMKLAMKASGFIYRKIVL